VDELDDLELLSKDELIEMLLARADAGVNPGPRQSRVLAGQDEFYGALGVACVMAAGAGDVGVAVEA